MNKNEAMVSILYLRSLFEHLESKGLSPAHFLETAGYRPDLADSFDAWIPVETLHDLWDFGSRHLNDPDIGLHVGETATIGRWGLVEYLVLNSGTVREIITNAAKYWQLILNSDKSIKVHQEGEMACLSFFSNQIRSRFFYEADLVYSVRLLRQLLSPAFRLAETRLAYKKPCDLSEYHRILGGRISFDRPGYAILFPYEDLDRPLSKANPVLLSILEEHASGVLADIKGNSTLTERVERFIQIHLPEISIDRVARHFFFSVRTLQRRLKEEGNSFRQILDEARKKKAHSYLMNQSISLGEITFMLGFSEPSAFNQAARRWFGTTPGDYRCRQVS